MFNDIRMKVYKNIQREELDKVLSRPTIETKDLEDIVDGIIEKVKEGGDQALFEFNQKFDKVKVDALQVSRSEIENACNLIDPKLKEAIKTAKVNIERFHSAQQEETLYIETMPGVQCCRL